jgi:hypothetical protein
MFCLATTGEFFVDDMLIALRIKKLAPNIGGEGRIVSCSYDLYPNFEQFSRLPLIRSKFSPVNIFHRIPLSLIAHCGITQAFYCIATPQLKSSFLRPQRE